MSKPSHASQPLAVQPVYLAASAINSVIHALPAGSAYFIGIVLITTELTTDAIRSAYAHRWPIETNFSVAPGTCAMEMPRAWSKTGVERRSSLALLAGSLLKAIAAVCGPLPMGPWDTKAVASAGRLANHLALHTTNFVPLALKGFAPRIYRKIPDPKETTELPLPLAA
ncbi:MAG TPA: hypothetical protein VGX03_02935 [Candidatus Binatia bacterium]|nr:hypothetical protein [Candidatus Binatia bacterium]